MGPGSWVRGRLAGVAGLLMTAAAIPIGGAGPGGTAAGSVGTGSVRVDGPEPGLALAIRPVRQAEGSLAEDRLPVRTLGLEVERGAPPTPFTAAGPFRAEWRGFLEVPQRDDYVFSFAGLGSLSLEIDGELVLDGSPDGERPLRSAPLRLRKGARALVARYRTPLSGAARVRVLWESRKFAAESIPPTALSHDPGEAELLAGRLRREGRMLVATRRCTACHARPEAGMPELAMRGPGLDEVGARLGHDWLAAWIADPRQLRADARMPQLLRGSADERARDAADLAAHLAGLGAEPEAPAGRGDPRRGARAWQDLGCFACHGFGGADGEAWVSLEHAAAKFRPGALAAFLREPRRHEPWIRMPDLKLGPDEALDLEVFIREELSREAAAGALPAAPAGDPVRGARRFAELGCAACHEGGVAAASPAAPALPALLADAAAWTRGCLAEDGAGGAAPDFGLSGAERAALRAFAAAEGGSLGRDTAADFAARQLVERRCDACHLLDGRTALWTLREPPAGAFDPAPRARAGDEAVEVAQLRPALTRAGEKLRPEWTEAFLRGDLPSPRPWLHARMPRLAPDLAAGFAQGLAAQHGLGAEPGAGPDGAAPIDAERAAVGRGLVEQEGGFGCVTCHAVGSRKPTALFEVQGIDLAEVAGRLRPDFYRTWMLDPPRFEAAAKMPKYAGEDRRTALPAYAGDAQQQFDAIWEFLRAAKEAR